MPHSQLKLSAVTLVLLLLVFPAEARAQARRRAPAGGRVAFVVDERLSALRDAPRLSANLLQRLGRGRAVAVAGARETRGGVTFLKVSVTSRTGGWVQAEALARPWVAGEDARVLRLARASEEFERAARARIFLEAFPRSPLRPAALLVFGDAAVGAAARLSREAARRLDAREMEAGGAPAASYFLNFNGLDRWRRQGVAFTFDAAAKQFRYDGAAWREILARHPRSPEAAEARGRLDSLSRW
ncbi:MAG TPA: hypothetical protein VF659_13805 [Pyrinomonadaceae bacterium]